MMKQGKAFKDGGKFSRVFSVRMRWYIWRLKSKNSDVRRAAAEALGKIGSKEAVPHLAKALKDEDRDVRRAAVQALKEIEWQPQSQEEKILYLVAKKAWNELVKIGTPAIPYLARELEDGDEYVRREVVEALGEIGSKEAVPHLIKVLKYKRWWSKDDRDVRKAAAEALGKIGSKEAIPHLAEALKDEDHIVRIEAVEALGKIGWQPQSQEERILYLIAIRAWDKLVKIGPSTVPYLAKALKYEDVGKEAADALVKIGSKEAVPYLIKEVLESIPCLIEDVLGSKDWGHNYKARETAAWVLVKIGSKEAISYLVKVLKHDYRDMRRVAAEVLGEIGSKEAVPHLIEALNDKDSYVRQAAAKALGEIGSKKAIPHLIEVLKDKYIDVRIAAAEALRKIKRQSQNHEEKF